MSNSIEEVKSFWESNPLFTGESEHLPGSRAFFDEHVQTYYDDVFAGKFEIAEFIPEHLGDKEVLDLGCGVGFWTIEIQKHRKTKAFYSGDLTQNALDITSKRLAIYGYDANLSIQNAEQLTYHDECFDHVNCQGVIHHTPNTDSCIAEIARVLKEDGTACISVYYKNWFIRNWSSLSWIGKLLNRKGAGLKGRGREDIFGNEDTDEITRLYDGEDNPIGKSYSRQVFRSMLAPYFNVEKEFLYFFPARALPFSIPSFLHRFLAKQFGFMIHYNLKKK